jgi:UDP-N-acetyl-D-mannosaminuronic acid transferase (WecB/TagA/CpsF family)
VAKLARDKLRERLPGTVARAPRWMSNSGLEWLYRLSREPRRLEAISGA